LIEELKAWHIETFAPIMLTIEGLSSLGLKNLSNEWNKQNTWSPPNWTNIVSNNVPTSNPTVEFTILLREFMLGQSEWSGNLCLGSEGKTLKPSPNCYITSAGLVLNIKQEVEKAKTAKLTINYRPSQGLCQNIETTETFNLKN